MQKFAVTSVIATVGGFIAWFLGGIDELLITLITLIIIDYVTGIVRAVYQRKLSSSIGFKGIIKKILMIFIVGLSVALQNIMPEGVPLREITVLFFIANEGLSVLENAAGVIPLPDKLRAVLAQIHDKADKPDVKDSTADMSDAFDISEESAQDNQNDN